MWTWDSGASHVIRPITSTDTPGVGVTLNVSGVGGINEKGVLLPNEEILLNGPPLLPQGRTIRKGGWSTWWTPKWGPCLRFLSSEDQDLFDGLGKHQSTPTIRPIVHDDIPYISQRDADIIRSSIARRSQLNQGGSESFNVWIDECKAAPSRWFLGRANHQVDQCFKEVEAVRHVCLEAFHTYNLSCEDLFSEWESSLNCFAFLHNICVRCNIDRDINPDTQNSPVFVTENDTEKGLVECVETSPNSQDSDKTCRSDVDLDDLPEKNVEFGFTETVEFDADEPIERCFKDDVEIRACPAAVSKIEFDPHLLTNHPSRKGCKTCELAKRRRRKFRREGGASRYGEVPVLACDWLNPRETASNGSKYVLVVVWCQRGVVYAGDSKTKKGAVVDILDQARKTFGLTNEYIHVHSDGERVLDSSDVREYLRNWSPQSPGGTKHFGIPHCSNTNAMIESYILKVQDGARCLLMNAGMPIKQWPTAISHWCMAYNLEKGLSPHLNTTQLMPYGCFGKAVLGKKLRFLHKFETRTTCVCYVGANPHTSGGVRIIFRGANGAFRKSTVLARDIVWTPDQNAFTRTTKNLQDVYDALPEFESDNPVSQFQAQCDSCDKWRFIFFDPERLEGKDFSCQHVGLTCETPEDERVHLQFQDTDFEFVGGENSSGVVFDDDIECPVADGDTGEEERVTAREAIARRAGAEIKDAIEHLRRDLSYEGGSSCSDQPIDEKEIEVEAALNRLGMRKMSEKDVNKLRKIAENEVRADKCVSATARVIIVSSKEAMNENGSEYQGWLSSMGKEITCLFEKYKTLRLASVDDLQPGGQVLPSMILFSRKPCGRLKSRIVACGCFESTSGNSAYSSVVGHDSWVQMLVTNRKLGQACYTIDVENAFLQAQGGPEGRDPVTGGRTFVKPPKVCQKWNPKMAGDRVLWQIMGSLYGLRSAPSSWKRTLVDWLVTEGFTPCVLDDSIYLGPGGVKILLYVDDIIALGPDVECIAFLKRMREKFICTEWLSLSDATRENPLLFLGHEIFIEGDDLIISQLLYTRVLLGRLGYSDCRPLKGLNPEDFAYDTLVSGPKASVEDHKWYRSVCGGISYLALGTRPDVAAAVSILSEGQAGPTENHISAAKKLLRYLRGVSQFELRINVVPIEKGSRIEICCHYDANFACERARSGCVLFIDGSITHWISKRQKCITLSTAESELVSCAQAVRELVGLKNFLTSTFGLTGHGDLTFRWRLLGDNAATTLISKSEASVRRVRHLALSDLYCREVIHSEKVEVGWVESSKNGSDCLTKILHHLKSDESRVALSLVEAPAAATFAYHSIVEPEVPNDGLLSDIESKVGIEDIKFESDCLLWDHV